MVKALLVDERVARDERAGCEREQEAVGVGASRHRADAAHEHDPESDGDHAGDLAGGRPVVEEEDGTGEHEDRRRAARNGVDEAHLGQAIAGGEEGEVAELEHR